MRPGFLPTNNARYKSGVNLTILLLTALMSTASPCRSNADTQRAIDLIRTEQFANAVELLHSIIQNDPRCDPEEYHLSAIALLNLHQPVEGLNAAEEGALAFPDFEPAQTYFVSVINFTLSKQAAATRLQQALKKLPNSFVYRRALAEILLSARNSDGAAGALLLECIKHNPNDVESRGFYAGYLFAVHKEQEASEQIDEALKAPSSPAAQVDLYRTRAAIEDKRNNVDAATAAFERAVTIDRSLAQPSGNAELDYCDFLLRQGEDDRAAGLAGEVVKRQPSLWSAHFLLARALARKKDYDRAVNEAQKALDLLPTNGDQRPIRVFLSKSLHNVGREDQAKLHEQWLENH